MERVRPVPRISEIGNGRREGHGKVIGKAKNKKVSKKITNFQTQFSKAKSKEMTDELDELWQDIKNKGEQLADNMSWDSFIAYRDSIKNFMKTFLGEAYQVLGSRGRTRFGNQKIYIHIKKIDEKLVELGEDVIKGEKDKVDLISKIDEIRGLLLDLYQ
ncbi:YaaR family protein [Natranaerobius trueperi]|uniref:DUF327 domain-containing protein n=1 Tax=Natranaerobius trueperi TaxID=759412 RepID=A0A226BZW5_9FIRM|nr:YaaR family protein [Natranaerobius trueperi]OWZ83637.1 hypothetical protein CDO51_07395 [Natranaerobius trueperi]